jgi:hypothetical protein
MYFHLVVGLLLDASEYLLLHLDLPLSLLFEHILLSNALLVHPLLLLQVNTKLINVQPLHLLSILILLN